MYRAIEGSTCTSTFTKITIWGTGFQEDTDKKRSLQINGCKFTKPWSHVKTCHVKIGLLVGMSYFYMQYCVVP